MLSLLLLLGAGLVQPARPALDSEAMAKLRDREIISEAIQEGASSGSVRAIAILNATPEAAFEVLTDHAKFPEFMPRIDKTEISRRSETGERSAQTVDATLETVRFALDYRWDPAALRVEFTLAMDVHHDIKSCEGAWQLWELQGGRATLLEYRTTADIGRSVPGPLKRWLQTRGARDAVEAIRKRVESGGKYKK